eukprot:1554130-Rhodomonas_salina.4
MRSPLFLRTSLDYFLRTEIFLPVTAAICLQLRYAMSSTDSAYGGAGNAYPRDHRKHPRAGSMPRIGIRARYEMTGTDIGCAAIRWKKSSRRRRRTQVPSICRTWDLTGSVLCSIARSRRGLTDAGQPATCAAAHRIHARPDMGPHAGTRDHGRRRYQSEHLGSSRPIARMAIQLQDMLCGLSGSHPTSDILCVHSAKSGPDLGDRANSG